ncbi:hypothetical protein B0H14DRAFT_2602747 [Mycena olivaceomarginata]|nr:hypothetical protein B0H14DRAFT_2602747 [Mycena olivaceomarginata]
MSNERAPMSPDANPRPPANQEYLDSLTARQLMDFRNYLRRRGAVSPTYIALNAGQFLNDKWVNIGLFREYLWHTARGLVPKALPMRSSSDSGPVCVKTEAPAPIIPAFVKPSESGLSAPKSRRPRCEVDPTLILPATSTRSPAPSSHKRNADEDTSERPQKKGKGRANKMCFKDFQSVGKAHKSLSTSEALKRLQKRFTHASKICRWLHGTHSGDFLRGFGVEGGLQAADIRRCDAVGLCYTPSKVPSPGLRDEVQEASGKI